MAATTLAVGLRGIAAVTVSDRDTATAYASGSVPVLATPRLVALMEQAAVDATRGALAPGETTVGTRIDIAHLAATPTGRTVRAEATLEAIDGRCLRFSVAAWDGDVTIGEGTHLRAVIDEARFLEKLRRARDQEPRS
jgi:fluoroacetyl-CoA thioesterase